MHRLSDKTIVQAGLTMPASYWLPGKREAQLMITLCGFGVSNYYNKLKLTLLEKAIPFEERVVYPWQRQTFLTSSPMGKIPFVETEHGGLSESQVILEYLEERYPATPMLPSDVFERARCRELIQHIELNCEWVARRLYKEAFFGGVVSDETKIEARERLAVGLQAVARIARFNPYVFGSTLTAADCTAYVHFLMIRLATSSMYGEDMLERHLPQAAAYMKFMETRPHVQTMLVERDAAMAAFKQTGVEYECSVPIKS